ncbi:hypothetical protein [Brachybacterium sp. AOP3-A1-3]|uniref:hypothetical protein n=1 Tax=Brachybacterium sp. AOP3-A1-3 TaxID=3457699 RepID=UPI00403473BA
MSERHVTAVVLLSGSTPERSRNATFDAVLAQSRPADRLVVVAGADLPDESRTRLDQLLGDGLVDDVRTMSSTVGRAGAMYEALDLLDDVGPADDEALAEGPSEHGPSAHSASGHGASAPSLSTTEPAETSAPPGRRARAIDTVAEERRRTQQAEDLALVPERLRTERQRSGRRIGRTAGAAEESWLWFVTDAGTPGRDALERELEMAANSPNTGVVGAKRVRPRNRPAPEGMPLGGVRAEDEAGNSHDEAGNSHDEPGDAAPLTAESADALVDVGLTLTHGGRIITGVAPGEIDQGQADWREDVLAVALPGMLIREQTLRDVGGLDPDLPEPWAEIDLCRRVWRSGERVAVQSAARVVSPHPTRPLLERLQEQRTGQILVLLKHRSLLMALAMLILLPLTTLLRMAGSVAASQPRRAAMELRAWAAAMPRVGRVLSRSRAARRRARVPSGRLAPLYLPRGDSMRRWLEDTWTRLFADDDHRRRIRRTTWGISGTHHGVEDADYGRHVLWTVVVALASTVLGLFALRGLFGRGELTGPGLRALPESWAASWAAAWSSWIPGGLGERGPADPLIRLLGHLPIGGSSLVEVVVFAAVPASALAAWWAAGAITRAVGARLTLATLWALAPPLVSALAIGAWPLLVVHALLPLLALCIGRAIGLPHKVSQASVSAAAAGGLLLLIIGAVSPVLVLLTALGIALLAVAVPGRRLRLLWVLLPSLALHVPYLPVYLGHPETLLAVSGVPPRAASADTLDLLSLWPVAPGLQELLVPLVGTTGALLVPMLPVAPVVVAAVISPLLAGNAGRAGRFSILVAAVGLMTLLLTRSTALAVAGDQLVPAPWNALQSAILLALSVGAAASFDALARREEEDGGLRRAGTTVIGALVAVVCLATVAGWTLALPGQLRLDRVEGGEVPAAAADQGRTDARARVLVLAQQDDGTIEASLVVHGGDTVIQHATITDARAVDTVRSGESIGEDPARSALRTSVATMLSSGAEGSDAGEADQAAASLAIAYVVVEGDPSDQSDLVDALDSSSTLEKVTEGARGGMWRVLGTSPRAVVVGGSKPVALASGVIDATGRIPADSSERTVVLSERADSQWRATLDGTELEPVVVGDWAQGFVVPSGADGEIDIHREQPARLVWQILLHAVLALTIVISIPWRLRTRDAEEMYG